MRVQLKSKAAIAHVSEQQKAELLPAMQPLLPESNEISKTNGIDKVVANPRSTSAAVEISECPKKLREIKDKAHYPYFIVTIAIVYALPVIQLALAKLYVLHHSGNEDLCYYNHRCVRPWRHFYDINHVASNFGYIILGLGFLGAVRYRKKQWTETKAETRDTHGIPFQTDVMNSMGVALAMEGVLSATYHICPTDITFQFDTAFMFLIAGMIVLRLYQCRHPTSYPKAHKLFLTYATLIAACLAGIVFHDGQGWHVAVVILVAALLILCQVFMWQHITCFGNQARRQTTSGCCCGRCYEDLLKIVFVFAGNAAAVTCVTLKSARGRPPGMAMTLLLLVIANMVLYLFSYICTKFRNGEWRCCWLFRKVCCCCCYSEKSTVYYVAQSESSSTNNKLEHQSSHESLPVVINNKLVAGSKQSKKSRSRNNNNGWAFAAFFFWE